MYTIKTLGIVLKERLGNFVDNRCIWLTLPWTICRIRHCRTKEFNESFQVVYRPNLAKTLGAFEGHFAHSTKTLHIVFKERLENFGDNG